MESQSQNPEFRKNPEKDVATKPVFRVSGKARFKPAYSATETSSKI